MNALSNITLVALFALSFSGMLWALWARGKTTPRRITAVVACALMALVDAALLVTQTPPAP